MVGFVGMSLAVRGNLRVAAAARTSYGAALQLGYRTGTITGMLTDGLGLLGGTLIFMVYGEHAYEVLLGFGFGGTLLALFMRVGGGIYTKAADVGADLVGKVEAGIPEDDPRNAATIADNVGDNVGDCAGMAADIFESYEVTIVAAMILGYASFGHKGVIFPLLVRAIGVLGSIISTYTRQGRAQQHQRRGTPLGPPRVRPRLDHQRHRLRRAGPRLPALRQGLLSPSIPRPSAAPSSTPTSMPLKADFESQQRATPACRGPRPLQGRAVASSSRPTRASCSTPSRSGSNLGINGLDMRPAWTCLIGIILAITLNKVTSYYTHTQYEPVKSLAKSCQTGHATNIIQGFAVGYESAVVGDARHRRGDPAVGLHLRGAPTRSSSPTAWRCAASAC